MLPFKSELWYVQFKISIIRLEGNVMLIERTIWDTFVTAGCPNAPPYIALI
jgi:hypothetical protein